MPADPQPGQNRCGVLGDPIEHSLSPALHRAAFAALGLDWSYDAHRVPAGTLADFVGALDAGWRGVSMTMPLKREAVPLLDQATDRARLSGAVNTLVFTPEGIFGDNTDIPGAVAALRERGVDRVTTGTVLGGGATATSTGLALLELGASRVRVLVRDPARAGETVQVLRRHPSAPEVEVGLLQDGDVVGELVVSTIPAAAQGVDLVDRCRDAEAIFEVLYDPWPTPLAASATDRVVVSGLDLLVHQAAVQCTLFTGAEAPLAAMRAAGESALAARGTGS